MKNTLRKVFLIVFFMFASARARIIFAESPQDCTECHTKTLEIHKIPEECQSCHYPDMSSLEVTKTIVGTSEETIIDCSECHSDKEDEVNRGEHGIEGFDCTDCHTPHPTESIEVYTWEKRIPIEESEELCEQCHLQKYGEWINGTHGETSIGCTSCHDPHTGEINDSYTVPSFASLDDFLKLFSGSGVLIFIMLYLRSVELISHD